MDALPASDALDVFRTQFVAPLISSRESTDGSFAQQVARATNDTRRSEKEKSPAPQHSSSSAQKDASIPAAAPQKVAAKHEELRQTEAGVDSDGLEVDEDPLPSPVKQNIKSAPSPSPPKSAPYRGSRGPSSRRAPSTSSFEDDFEDQASPSLSKSSPNLAAKQQQDLLRSPKDEVEDQAKLNSTANSARAPSTAPARDAVSTTPALEDTGSATESCTEDEQEAAAPALKRPRGQATTRGGRGTGYRRAGTGSRQKKAF